MLMQMAMILAIIGTLTEILLVHKVKFIDRLYHDGSHILWVQRWHVEGMVWNTIGSFALSFAQGKMFGATGLVIAMSGALSTGFSQVYFALENYIKAKHGFPTLLAYCKDRFAAFRQATKGLGQVLADLWQVIVFAAKVITAPFRAARWTKNHYNNFKAHSSHP